MALSMYSASVPVYVQYLSALAGVLKKAEAHCAAKKIDPNVLVTARLFPDMYALARQVQIATDHAKGSLARLAGVEIPSYPDTETTFAELQARIAKTLDYVQSFKPAEIDGSDNKQIVLDIRGNKFEFSGADYLTRWALPNFFFHTTTAYAIARHNGVEVGKRDFMKAE
jgi:Uncharacterized protein conserved in bacteria